MNGYGINTDNIPVSWTGNVKVNKKSKSKGYRQCYFDIICSTIMVSVSLVGSDD